MIYNLSLTLNIYQLIIGYMFEFDGHKKIVGMVHLKALTGSPKFTDMDIVKKHAIKEAKNLENGGIDGILVENYGDKPFWKIITEDTFKSMLDVCKEIKKEVNVPIGVNVLRNDWKSALMIADELDLSFIRVNVYIGITLTEQGIIEGEAAKIQRFKRRKNIDAKVYSDIHVKHGKTIYPERMEDAALDSVERGLADGVIVTGSSTGKEVDVERLKKVREVIEVPVIIGSGLNIDNMEKILPHADGAIVGTNFKEGGNINNPVSQEKVKSFMERVRSEFQAVY